jgi:hypothetical protein
MTDAATAPEQNAPASPPKKSRLTQWLGIAVGLIFAIIALVKVINIFVLPACDSSSARGAIRSIFKDKNLPEPTLTDAKVVGGPSSENTCQASYALPSEKGTLTYRVYWEGWTAKVMISKAETL